MTNWQAQLNDAGLRITAQRRAVVDVLGQSPAPLSPLEILDQARRLQPTLGLATVYRSLAILVDLHMVRRVHRDDGCRAYVPSSPGHRHVLICRDCQRAVDFPGGSDLQSLIDRIEVATGYEVDDHLLQLSGVCAACRTSP